MNTKASDSFGMIRRFVNDPFADYTTPDYVLGFMDDAQKLLYNEMLSMPLIGRPAAIIVIPSIGVGAMTLHKLFDKGQPLELVTDIWTLKERPLTSTNEGDWRRMNPTADIKGMTPGAFNHVYRFTGDDIELPGADHDLQLRVFCSVQPQPLVKEDSPMVPGTDAIIAVKAAGLIAEVRGSVRLATRYLGTPGMHNGMADIEQDAFFQKIVQSFQETPFRQKAFSGRVKAYL